MVCTPSNHLPPSSVQSDVDVVSSFHFEVVSLLHILALGLVSGAAIMSHLFAVMNFESIIHELSVLQG